MTRQRKEAMILYSGATVKQYPYRSATVSERLFKLPRNTVRDLERELAELAGVSMNNHTAYEISRGDEPPLYIMFSDDNVSFGTKIEKRSW